MNTAPSNQTHSLITPDHLRRLAIVYIRQSTEQQVRDNSGSTDYQRSLTAVAQSFGWSDDQIEIIEEDLGKSGSSTERRTGWKRLQTMIAAKQVGAVFVATISRLSRQVIDFELFRTLAALCNTLLYVDGHLIDPADSNDTIVSQITATVAQYENRKRTELMSQARKTKARQGLAVSVLPVGWIKGPDGKYDYDPETKDIIRTIIDTFWRARALRRTVIALAKAGVQIPSRDGQRISFKKPTINRVGKMLLHPAYTGTYVYGRTESQPGGPVLANGQTKRIKVPEERWIKTYNHHPPYMTQEQQDEIKSILKKNRFSRRDRAGRGPALTQGLLRCAVCNASMGVTYQRLKSYSYICGWDIEPCTQFTSSEFDKNILAEVFKVLKTPPLEMLKSALEETLSQERRRLNWIESERERLRHEERLARERADFTRGSLRRVHFDALEKLEKVLQEKEQFEQKISLEPLADKSSESEEELEELCRIARDVPALWHQPAVTNQERKEILRCIIDHIVVAATKEKIDATIFWKSGSQTSLSMWRGLGRQNLIRELHAQNLTTLEIKDHLASGKTSTGQVINMSLGYLRVSLRKLGVKPKRHSIDYVPLRQKATELRRQGRTWKWIAQHFNEQGFATVSGKPWKFHMVYWLLRTMADKPESLENLHRNAITEALARGLNHQQMAVEFNKKKLPRGKNKRRWTERNIKKRCFDLNRRRHKRAQKGSTSTEPPERGDLPTTS